MICLMDKTEEDIIHFELMLRGTPEQRMEAYHGLQVIVKNWQGTPYGKKAKQILDNNNNNLDPVEEKDPELSRFGNRWIGIHKLTDVDLPIFLRELQAKPAIAARLRREVIKDLRQWIAAALPGIGPQTPAEEIKALDRFCAIPALKTYEAELDELKQLRHELFQLRYERVKQRIDAAIAAWSFDEAWNALKELSNPPASFERRVRHFEEEIYTADQKRQEVNQLLEKLPQESPAAWGEAARLVNYARELSSYLNDEVSEAWRLRLSAAQQRSLQEVTAFLEKQVGKAREFSELRTFQTAYKNLPGADAANIPLRKQWFQNALDLFMQNVANDIATADSPEVLGVIRLGLVNEQVGLPDIFVAELNEWRIRIDEISASWKAIRVGEDFPAGMPTSGPLPEAFIKTAEKSRERLDRIQAALVQLESSDGPEALTVYVEAARAAGRILQEHGNHALALKLKEKAERKIVHHKINSAIAEWQLDRLLELCRPLKQDPVCSYYLANYEALGSLHELVSEEAFTGSRESQAWWQLWRARVDRLPPGLPDALRAALAREQDIRADQWHAVLATLSEMELSPEDCEQVAASLKDELTRLDLKWRQVSFLHKTTIGYAERFIWSRQWQQAEEKIAELDHDNESVRRLKTLLAVERARETGVVKLSQVLKGDWSHISLYLKQRAHDILAEALAEAWEGQEDEALKSLRMVMSRVLATGDASAVRLEEFTQWEEWLTVESYVRSVGGLAGVKKLVLFLSMQAPPNALVSKRLQRLIDCWEEQKDKVMLAWAYEAFQDYVAMPVQRPLAELSEQNSQLAGGVESALHSDDQLKLAGLKAKQSELKHAEDEWARLTDYLNELPRTLANIKLAPSFYEVRELLSLLIETWQTLDKLNHADLRQPAERENLDACRRTLNGKLAGLSLQKKLLDLEGQLEPLTRLNSLQTEIVRAAGRCGDDEEWDQKGLFGQLGKRLHDMIEVFRRIGAEGGTMWQLISAEYCITVHARAGSLLPKPSPADLSDLAGQFAELETEEQRLERLWQELRKRTPIVPPRSEFEPESYLEFLGLFPKEPPHSRRGYVQFKRNFAMTEPIPTILAQSRRFLPEWICKYLDEGIPQYAPEA
jgi:hypothetical protein